MIKNIIFDMGRVLVEFYPEDFLTKEGITDKEERELLLREIFHHEDWTNMDAGIMSEQEMYDEAVKRIPEHLHQTAHNLIFDWNDPIIPVKGMEDFVRECKEKGYGIYLLSNASVAQPVYWLRIPGHQYFDGTVVSALEKIMKPDIRIYQILLDRYGLKAEECLFIDDVARNIKGAEKAGIRGYLFDGDVDKLRKYINDL
ncbi:MAG: HAD family phosphatase [Lachnospiraceae bacterium]|nr:HAD family phosphatase [Erysipelotrichaceae bacterium]MBR3352155.1 HAD family phosphatase [Erysipelotrichaceae bacterium]MBR4342458.1 HAD family phosphatase [Lachnospiraceae bacterium]